MTVGKKHSKDNTLNRVFVAKSHKTVSQIKLFIYSRREWFCAKKNTMNDLLYIFKILNREADFPSVEKICIIKFIKKYRNGLN